ncbi:Rrf2 family transcriptional regulator [Cyanobium sp. Morenito 9A2]|uniref:Rrf2 family transcriptional regulator n=1 Tax=Cyanobium sp. Morenito 9A2 TaxID=2823718 RepID=UPI0020CF9708|nr:Rrf2 family transcriptional regulator [Cyanobium sp. Morenito 9A2]MCP9849427.1 Rrf2 family transcriptional regulator [Cyanobium sp. Morenito 9A2]
MLRKRTLYAIKALVELARDPQRWQSVNQLAQAQQLPAPMLEQLLLQLRRAQLVEARRGRSGGYRLAQSARDTRLAAILAAVEQVGPQGVERTQAISSEPEIQLPEIPSEAIAGDRVLSALQRRLSRALERELEALSLEELLFDLRSWQECLREDGGLMVG